MSGVQLARKPDREHAMRSLPGAPDGWEVEAHDALVDGTIYHVLTSRDEIAPGDPRWHLSISGEHDVPPWKVMAAVAHERRPGVCFVIGVPPRSWWINVRPHCLHLWELRDPALEGQWRFESRGDTPS